MRRLCLGVVSAVLLSASASGQATLEPRRPMEEKIRTSVPIGGNVVVGAVAGVLTNKIDLTSAYAWVPGQGPGTLCVELRSIDGSYVGTAEFDAPSQTGWYRLKLPSAYEPILEKWTVEELAAIVRRAASCTRSVGADFGIAGIISWSNAQTPSEIIFLLNSGRLSADIFLPQSGKVVRCNATKVGPRTAFDKICVVPMPASKISGVSSTEMKFRLSDFGQPLPEITIVVALP